MGLFSAYDWLAADDEFRFYCFADCAKLTDAVTRVRVALVRAEASGSLRNVFGVVGRMEAHNETIRLCVHFCLNNLHVYMRKVH